MVDQQPVTRKRLKLAQKERKEEELKEKWNNERVLPNLSISTWKMINIVKQILIDLRLKRRLTQIIPAVAWVWFIEVWIYPDPNKNLIFEEWVKDHLEGDDSNRTLWFQWTTKVDIIMYPFIEQLGI
jgi:hypothetical protein